MIAKCGIDSGICDKACASIELEEHTGKLTIITILSILGIRLKSRSKYVSCPNFWDYDTARTIFLWNFLYIIKAQGHIKMLVNDLD